MRELKRGEEVCVMQRDEWRHKRGDIRVRINNDYMIGEGEHKNREDRGGLCVCDSMGRREEGTAALVIKPLLIY